MSGSKHPKKKTEAQIAEKEEKKKKEMEKRRVAQFLHGVQPHYQTGRDNKTRAKLAAKLAHRKKTPKEEDTEKEALRVQLLQEARQAQIEMEERRAERIILEERLRVFQERLERELAEAAEYAALKFLEEHERREREEVWRKAEEMRKEKEQEEKEKEVEDDNESLPPEADYKEAVYARLLQYEIARFEFLEVLRKRHFEKMNQELEEIKENEELVEIVETSKEQDEMEKEEEPETASSLDDEQENRENHLKEKVLRKLKSKLQKRIMVRKQKEQDSEENLKRGIDREDERRSWEREDEMEHAQYMRRGFRGGF